MQRTLKLKIVRPADEKVTWETLGYFLRGLSFKVCRMSNYCMTHLLLHALKQETENLNPQGNLYCYPRLSREYPEVPSAMICAAETRARKVFHSKAADVLRSNAALPSFRKNSSIPVPVAGYKIHRDENGDYIASLQLLSRQGAKAKGMKGRVELVLAANWRDRNAMRVLQGLEANVIKRGVASLYRSQKNWYLSIPYASEPKVKEDGFVPGLVMGVCFGVHQALVYGFNFLLKRGAISGHEVLSHQKKYLARRLKIQEQYNWSGRIGHGRNRALKPLHKLYETENNFRSLTNSRYANWVVEIAVKNHCGEIHLAEKSKLRTDKPLLLERWPLADLESKICAKAEEQGIKVVMCKDALFRERCSECGAVVEAATDRQGFICEACGFGKTEKAGGYIAVDYNAAKNLALYKT